MSESRIRALTERLLALDGLLNRIEDVYKEEGVVMGRQVRSGVGRRLIMPGQILRFPDQASWVEFKTLRFVDDSKVEIIQYTDPLGFDTGGHVYDDASKNPKNYLRRAQLPPLQIDMTNVYNPTITGVTNSDPLRADDLFIPFIASRDGKYIPEVNAELVQKENAGVTRVISSYVPRTFTIEEGIDHFMDRLMERTGGAGLDDEKGAMSLAYMGAVFESNFDDYISAIINPAAGDERVPQIADCSRPRVGCFWFNDGKRVDGPFGQIELPKDPRCRECVLVKFKAWTVV